MAATEAIEFVPVSGATSGADGEEAAEFLYHCEKAARAEEEKRCYARYVEQRPRPLCKQDRAPCQFIGREWEECGKPGLLRYLIGDRSLFLCAIHKQLVERRTRCDALDKGKRCHAETLGDGRLCGEHRKQYNLSKNGKRSAVCSWRVYNAGLDAQRRKVAQELVLAARGAETMADASAAVLSLLSRPCAEVETWGGPVPLRPPPPASKQGRRPQPPPRAEREAADAAFLDRVCPLPPPSCDALAAAV